MVAEKQQEAKKCPKCGSELRKNFSSISGNSKYVTWSCESCTFKQTQCLGVQSSK